MTNGKSDFRSDYITGWLYQRPEWQYERAVSGPRRAASTESLQQSIQNTGVVIMGRNSVALAKDPNSIADNYEYQVPIFVLAHRAPQGKPKENDRLTFTFLIEGKVMELPGSRTHLEFRLVK